MQETLLMSEYSKRKKPYNISYVSSKTVFLFLYEHSDIRLFESFNRFRIYLIRYSVRNKTCLNMSRRVRMEEGREDTLEYIWCVSGLVRSSISTQRKKFARALRSGCDVAPANESKRGLDDRGYTYARNWYNVFQSCRGVSKTRHANLVPLHPASFISWLDEKKV